jgi:F420-dependent oxidoreductase-like protein
VLRLPDPCLIVLVGAPGSGKSHWAAEWFSEQQVVSSDRMRAVVGLGEHDQRASKDAFAVVDLVVDRRLRRRLTTVIDSTALEDERRRTYVAMAREHGVEVHAVAFSTDAETCRARNRAREAPVPSKVLTGMIERAAIVVRELTHDGFDGVHEPQPVAVVPAAFVDAPRASRAQEDDPVPLEFGLQISKWDWPGGPAEMATQLGTIARVAEECGFTSVSVMDHFLQIPGVGRHWEDMPESYTTLGYLAGVTSRVRLGALVTGVTYRNIAHLAKIVATLDVLSGGRAFCGIGAAWFKREHELYGWDLPPIARRYDLLEDALELLPLMWGPGSPSFEGRTFSMQEAICYPRPLQERVPIMIGGSGERRTLRLVARYADACNLFGDPDTVRHKIAVLRKHCDEVERDPSEIRVTQLSVAGVTPPDTDRRGDGDGSVDEQIGRFRQLADAGVHEVIVGLYDPGDVASIKRFAPVIDAFASG